MAKISICDICGKPVEKNIGIKLPNHTRLHVLCEINCVTDIFIADICKDCATALQETVDRLSVRTQEG